MRGDESILLALKASREGEHPLSQSVAASPEEGDRQPFFAKTTSLASPIGGIDEPHGQFGGVMRPILPERSVSALSTTASVRTVRPSDLGMDVLNEQTQSTSPTLSFTEGAGADRSGGLLGGASRLLKTVRDRSTVSRTSESREPSSGRTSSEAGDTHADPSLAISTASAAGTLDPPQALKEMTPAPSRSASKATSPAPSQHGSAVLSPTHSQHDIAFPTASLSALSLQKPPTPMSRPPSRLPNESAEVDFERADNELMRRHIAEHQQSSEPETRTAQMLSPDSVPEACPPSPDDETDRLRRARFSARSSVAASMAPSLETSPASPNSSLLPLMTPTSSDDRFAPGLSIPQPYTLAPPVPSSTLSVPHGRACNTNQDDTMSNEETVEMAPQSSRHRTVDDEADLGYPVSYTHLTLPTKRIV